ncbi:uncharacterized protein LOC135828046 [Sycon ciliatum]|uniref:uncharacterized protein LOC135828046 n=1 Tax=Sycon ciliatum TaxID=27933 RepID=UPI0031F6446D
MSLSGKLGWTEAEKLCQRKNSHLIGFPQASGCKESIAMLATEFHIAYTKLFDPGHFVDVAHNLQRYDSITPAPLRPQNCSQAWIGGSQSIADGVHCVNTLHPVVCARRIGDSPASSRCPANGGSVAVPSKYVYHPFALDFRHAVELCRRENGQLAGSEGEQKTCSLSLVRETMSGRSDVDSLELHSSYVGDRSCRYLKVSDGTTRVASCHLARPVVCRIGWYAVCPAQTSGMNHWLALNIGVQNRSTAAQSCFDQGYRLFSYTMFKSMSHAIRPCVDRLLERMWLGGFVDGSLRLWTDGNLLERNVIYEFPRARTILDATGGALGHVVCYKQCMDENCECEYHRGGRLCGKPCPETILKYGHLDRHPVSLDDILPVCRRSFVPTGMVQCTPNGWVHPPHVCRRSVCPHRMVGNGILKTTSLGDRVAAVCDPGFLPVGTARCETDDWVIGHELCVKSLDAVCPTDDRRVFHWRTLDVGARNFSVATEMCSDSGYRLFGFALFREMARTLRMCVISMLKGMIPNGYGDGLVVWTDGTDQYDVIYKQYTHWNQYKQGALRDRLANVVCYKQCFEESCECERRVCTAPLAPKASFAASPQTINVSQVVNTGKFNIAEYCVVYELAEVSGVAAAFKNGTTFCTNTSSISLTGLEEDSKYHVHCYVETTASARSNDSITYQVRTQPAAPSAAPILNVTDIAWTSFSLSWTKLDVLDHNGPLSGYQVKSSDGRVLITNDLSVRLTGYQPNSAYEVSVAAIGYRNLTGPQGTLQVRTLAEAPLPPKAIFAASAQTINVSLVVGSSNFNIAEYCVVYELVSVSGVAAAFQNGTTLCTNSSSISLTGLEEDSKYHVHCYVETAASTRSNDSITYHVRTQPAAPSAAPVLSVTDITRTSFKLSWTELDVLDRNGPIWGYRMRESDGSLLSINFLDIRVSGKQPNSTYEVSVAALGYLHQTGPWATIQVRTLD